MSQPPGRKSRRDSILKQRQTVDMEFEETTYTEGEKKKVSRRVSFHNVKTVQNYAKDDHSLLDGSPIKERINETAGSDAILTPGRSHHSDTTGSGTLDPHAALNANDTMAVFATPFAAAPIATAPRESVATLDRTINASMAMDISDIQNSTTIDGSSPTLAADDTMRIFERIPATSNDSTMRIFEQNASRLDSFNLNPEADDTMLVFGGPSKLNRSNNENRSPHRYNTRAGSSAYGIANRTVFFDDEMDISQTNAIPAYNRSADDTMRVFGGLDSNACDAADTTLDNTLRVFGHPMQMKSKTPQTLDRTHYGGDMSVDQSAINLEISRQMDKTTYGGDMMMDDTVAEIPTKNVRNVSQTGAKLDSTITLATSEDMPSRSGKSNSSLMDLACDMDMETMIDDSIVQVTSDTKEFFPANRINNETIVLSSDQHDRSRGHLRTDRNSTFDRSLTNAVAGKRASMAPNKANESGVEAGRHHIPLNSFFSAEMGSGALKSAGDAAPVLKQSDDIPTRAVEIMDESSVSPVKMDISSRSAVLKNSRLSNSTMVDDLHLSVNQSHRSRRSFSSVNVTLNESMANRSIARDVVIETPSRTSVLNTTNSSTAEEINSSISEQLTSLYRRIMYEPRVLQIAYLTPHPEQEFANIMRAETASKLLAMTEEKKESYIASLESVLPTLSGDQAKAIRAMNPRKLDAVERDAYRGGRTAADNDRVRMRMDLAKETLKSIQDQRNIIAPELDEAEEEDNACAQIGELEEEIKRKQNQVDKFADFDLGDLTNIKQKYAEMEANLAELKRESVRLDLMYVKAAIEHMRLRKEELERDGEMLKEIQRRDEANRILVLEMTRNIRDIVDHN